MLNEMDAANTKLQEARVEFTEAHQSQTKLLTENAQAVSAEKVGIIPDILMAVSYTHLDVYKRQESSSARSIILLNLLKLLFMIFKYSASIRYSWEQRIVVTFRRVSVSNDTVFKIRSA